MNAHRAGIPAGTCEAMPDWVRKTPHSPRFADSGLKWRLIAGVTGGGGGIRTRDTVSRIHTFQACAFNHSATPPSSVLKAHANLISENGWI